MPRPPEPESAIRLANELRSSSRSGLEEPVPYHNPAATRKVRAHTSIPIATGERLATRWQYRTLFEPPAADIIQPDDSRVGVYLRFDASAHVAALHGMQVAPTVREARRHGRGRSLCSQYA